MSRVSALAINAADHLISKGRLDAAASILQNYLSTNTPRPEVLQRLGRIFLAQGRSEEAVPLLKKALDQFREPVEVPCTSDSSSLVVHDATETNLPIFTTV